MERKKCFKCGEEKELTEFYKHPEMADGRVGKCKVCNNADVRKNRADKIEYYRSFDRARGSRQTAEYQREYRTKNPDRARAHRMLNYHVRVGNMTKSPCETCGTTKYIHGHHDDYSKPLDVRWLCAVHHSQWHQEHGD